MFYSRRRSFDPSYVQKAARPISMDTIARYAPSVMTQKPIGTASDKYSFIPTTTAIDIVQSAGWRPYWAEQTRVNKKSKQGFQRHVIKFTMGETLSDVGDERLDLVLMNSHDTGTAFKLMIGVFRLVCSNGLIVGRQDLGFTHKHIGFDQQAFLESTRAIASHGKEVARSIDDFKTIELTPNEQGVFAAASAQLIGNETDGINLPDIIRPRRLEDREPTLWNTYNTAQEAIIRGGIRRKDRKATRKVKAIDKDIKLNKALWVLTEKMAELKLNQAA